MTGFRFFLVAALLLPLAACEQVFLRPPKVETPVAYGPETERQVESALQRYRSLVLAMDAQAVSEMYAPDGVWERQSGPLVGRDAIRQALANTGGVQVQSIEMTTSYISYNGPAVVHTGDFNQTAKLPNGKIVSVAGRFEATWLRSDSGTWWIKRMLTRPNAKPPGN
jgi:uncharacterized protein (TIGR02246 family)